MNDPFSGPCDCRQTPDGRVECEFHRGWFDGFEAGYVRALFEIRVANAYELTQEDPMFRHVMMMVDKLELVFLSKRETDD